MSRVPLLLIWAAIVSCRTEEQELVERYLEASRRDDDQMVALLSMVAFPGKLVDYRVVSVGSELRARYRLSAVRERVEAAEARRNEQFEAFSEFRRTNYDELLRVQKLLAEDPERKLEGRLAELDARWNAFRDERRQVVTSLHEAERALEREVRLVSKSLQQEAEPEQLEGETLTKAASIRVTTEEGGGEQAFVVTLTRFDLRNSRGAVVPSRWVVSAVAPENAL
ncbi:MAG TPA: hypothetical protein VIG29_15980 [Vicinamibacteria bacterium]